MTKQNETIKPLNQFLSENGFSGCSDGGCRLQKNTGMVTNGGCRCLRDLHYTEINKLYHFLNKFYTAHADLVPTSVSLPQPIHHNGKDYYPDESGWYDIECCPKDSTWFLGYVDGALYKFKAFYNSDVINYNWVMHINTAAGQHLKYSTDSDGNEIKIQTKEAAPRKYQVRTIAYTKGMNHNPTHWQYLPEA